VTTWIAAVMLVAAVALFVAAPLTDGLLRRRRDSSNRLEIERLEHDRGLAIQGLRELEFDHEMGKIDDADYAALRAQLEQRALVAMSASERARKPNPPAPLRLAPKRAMSAAPVSHRSASSTQRADVCPRCGVRAGAGHNFCTECGASLPSLVSVAMPAE
jgi:cytochrome c-type biogenesis protein CcmI